MKKYDVYFVYGTYSVTSVPYYQWGKEFSSDEEIDNFVENELDKDENICQVQVFEKEEIEK